MATLKHEKAKKDNHRKKLEKSIDAILASQELVVEELHKLLAALGTAEETSPVKKVNTRRKPK